jgi:hypothetical protein
MRSIPTETAYRFRMLAERAGRLRTQAEMLRTQADRSILEARDILQAAGLDPETDDPITDDGAMHNGIPLPVGTVLRRGQPIEDDLPLVSSAPLEPDAVESTNAQPS